MERWIERHEVFRGRIVAVSHGTVELDDGHRTTRELVEHRGAAAVVAYTGHAVVLVKQFRLAAGKDWIEIPAGKIEENDRSLEQRAITELEEETGYRAGNIRRLGAFYPSAGILTEQMHLFLATELTPGKPSGDEDERIEVIEMSLDDVRAGLRRFQFEDAKTIIGLYALFDHLRSGGF